MRAVVAGKMRAKTTIREATHLDADGASIEGEACRHCRRGRPFASLHCRPREQRSCARDNRPAHFEPSDRAIVAALAIVQHYEVNARAVAAREIWRWSPEKRGERHRHQQTLLGTVCGWRGRQSSSRCGADGRRYEGRQEILKTRLLKSSAPRPARPKKKKEQDSCQNEAVNTGALVTSGCSRLPRVRGGSDRTRVPGWASRRRIRGRHRCCA